MHSRATRLLLIAAVLIILATAAYWYLALRPAPSSPNTANDVQNPELIVDTPEQNARVQSLEEVSKDFDFSADAQAERVRMLEALEAQN